MDKEELKDKAKKIIKVVYECEDKGFCDRLIIQEVAKILEEGS